MNKDNKKSLKPLNLLVPMLLGAVIVFSGFKLIQSILSYKTANDEYSELQDYIIEEERNLPADSNETEEQVALDEDVITFPLMEIDYQSLRAINEDYMGWIYIPSLELSYPYVKGEDNEKYLHLTFEGKSSSSGAVFMDSYNYPNFRDFNTFIYAHNMKDKSMFGSLKLLGKDKSLIENDPYIYIYTPKASYQFKIFAYYVTRKGSNTYQIMLKPEEYDRYIQYISTVNELSLADNEINFEEYPRILTLSTCQGSAGTSNRFVVHAALMNKIDRE